MENQINILIVSKPGIMRDSLVSFLRALSDVQTIWIAGDTATAWQMHLDHPVDTIVMDSNLSESEMLELLQRVRAHQPAANVITLVESIRQQQQCLAAGARHALLKGFLNEQLRDAVLQVPV
jgi:DNA-binding NarL/FixJ family response regulator